MSLGVPEWDHGERLVLVLPPTQPLDKPWWNRVGDTLYVSFRTYTEILNAARPAEKRWN